MLTPRTEPVIRFSGRLERDAKGRLFDRRIRDQLLQVPLFEHQEGLTAVEAIRALILVARNLRYFSERSIWGSRQLPSTRPYLSGPCQCITIGWTTLMRPLPRFLTCSLRSFTVVLLSSRRRHFNWRDFRTSG